MKKSILLCSTFLALVSLSACGNNNDNKTKDSSPKTEQKQKKNTTKDSKKKESTKKETAETGTISNKTKQEIKSQLPAHKDASDFANKYGESPASYLYNQKGVPAKDALQAVPDSSKTPEEKQTQKILENPSKYDQNTVSNATSSTTNNTTNTNSSSKNNTNNNNKQTSSQIDDASIDSLNVYTHPEVYQNRFN